ncbi:MAG: MFS transporter [Prevotellaceae bacterium]|jgi:dipeptide/tripeptide permease|nr:MFS transporter [Prevotellaceae bacterium]
MKKLITSFSKAFWVANFVELLERCAYYGVFIVLSIYLSRILGFTDIQAGFIGGFFSAGLYLLPTFSGAYADKIGFRNAMLLAFALLTTGYAGLGILPTILESGGLVNYGMETTFTGLRESASRWAIIPVLLLIMFGGSFIKSVISGTVAKETTVKNRARGFSIFYMMINIGAFSGKTVVEPLRKAMGNEGLVVLNYFAAAVTLLAFVIIFFLYKSNKTESEGKSFGDIWSGLYKALTNGRLLGLMFIVSGFWLVQGQMYTTMPKYVLRMAGEGAAPGWYANVNPLIVVIFVGWITHLMRKRKAITSMIVGMCLLPFAAFVMATGNMVGSDAILGMHPIAFMMVAGIAIQGLAETFISPRYLEYFSLQAPTGQEGLYLGFSNLHSFFSWLVAFVLSGYLLDRYCPDPNNFASHAEWQAASQHAHYIWFIFVGVAILSIIALVIYSKVVKPQKTVISDINKDNFEEKLIKEENE